MKPRVGQNVPGGGEEIRMKTHLKSESVQAQPVFSRCSCTLHERGGLALHSSSFMLCFHFQALSSLPFQLLPSLDLLYPSSSLQFDLHKHQTSYVFKLFFWRFKFYPQRQSLIILLWGLFEVLQLETGPLSDGSHFWLFQSPTVRLSHHLQSVSSHSSFKPFHFLVFFFNFITFLSPRLCIFVSAFCPISWYLWIFTSEACSVVGSDASFLFARWDLVLDIVK